MGVAKSFPPISHRVRLALILVALAATSAAQAIIERWPWISFAGFAVAAALLWYCGRDKLAVRAREPALDTPDVPAEFWLLFSAGLILCSAAGFAVFARAAPLVTHGCWIAGLLCLAVGARYANRGRERQPRAWTEVVALTLIVVGCAVLFGWQLSTLPLDVHGDETEVGLDALRLLETKPFNLFRTSWFRLPIFHALPTAIGLEVFGYDLTGLRATSAIIGTITVVLTFAVARRLWNLEVAVISAIVLATGRYFMHLSRAGYHYVDTPCVSIAVLLLFLIAWRERRLGTAVWCGILLGLGVQTYYASRLIAPLLLVTWLLWLRRSDPANRRARFVTLLVMGISAAATAAPMIGFFSDHWTDLWRRSIDTSLFAPAAIEHLVENYPGLSRARIALMQLHATVLLFNRTPDTSLQYGYWAPLLDPISAVFFFLGFVSVCLSIRMRRSQLLLLWIVVPVVVGGAFTLDAPFYPRISGTLPFVAITIALGLTRVLDALRAVMLRLPNRFGATLERDGSSRRSLRIASAATTASLCVAVLATIVGGNVRTYFIDYAPANRYGPAIDIAHWINENGAGYTTYLLGAAPEFSIRHGTIRFINHGFTLRDIVDAEATFGVSPPDPATSRFVIMPRALGLIRRLQKAVGPLQIDPHRTGNLVQFYTAIPKQQLAAPASTVAPATPVTADDIAPKRATARINIPTPRWVALAFVIVCISSVALLAWLGSTAFVTTRIGRSIVPRAIPNRFWTALADARSDRAARAPHRITVALLLALIVLLGTGLRVYRLAELPAGFYCDEAGLGYNTWSLLQTGRDETGARVPLFAWSFDTSYKNPVWLYSAMLPISLLGLNELAVRITSAAYGSATILALFFLGRAVLGTWGGLVAAGVIAVIPWHLHFSRIAFELITFPFFLVWAVTCFVRSLQGRRLFAFSAILFAYSLYTYAIAKLFVPVFLAGCALLFRRTLWARRREVAVAVGVLVLAAIPLVGFDLQNEERAGHYFADTSVFAVPQEPSQLARRIAQQYASFFSPDFLFFNGDKVVRHAVRGHGELYLLCAPFLIVGIIVAGRRRNPLHWLLLWWLLVYPLAPALMTEAPTASRGIIGVPAFCLLIALGAVTLWRTLPVLLWKADAVRLAQWLLVAGGVLLTGAHVAYYWYLYSVEYPKYSAKYYTGFQYGHREVIDYFRAHADQYDLMVLTAHRSNQAHIFPLFYTKFPPRLFQEDHEGALRRTIKMQVGWLKEMERFEQYDRLLFAVTEDELEDLTDYEERARVAAPDGSTAFVLIDVFPGRSFISTWIVGGPYPIDDDSPPPASDPEDPLPEAATGSGWRVVASDEPEVDLNNLFTPDADEACAWAVNAVYVPVGRTVRVRAGFDDAGQVWINGERLELELQPRPDAPLVDPHVGEAQLVAGRNIVAVRSCEVYGDWYFYLNFLEADGKPVQGLEWEVSPLPDGRGSG